MRKSKRLLSLVLALVMVFTMISGAITANASAVSRMSAKDTGAEFSAANADAEGALTAASAVLQRFLPDILTLIGEDKVRDALGITDIKNATFADIIGGLVPTIAKLTEIPDAANPYFYTDKSPFVWTSAAETFQELGKDFNYIDFTLYGIFNYAFNKNNSWPDDVDYSTLTTFPAIVDAMIKYGNKNIPSYDNEKFKTLCYIFAESLGYEDQTTYRVVKNGSIIADKTAGEVIKEDTIMPKNKPQFEKSWADKSQLPTSWTIVDTATNKTFDLKLEDYAFSGMDKAYLVDMWISKLLANPQIGSIKLKETIDMVLGESMFNSTLTYDKITAPLNGLIVTAAENPFKAIAGLFPVVAALLDEILVPLLVKEGDTAKITENVLGMLDLGKLDLPPVAVGLLSTQFLPLDLNEILLNGYTYKIDGKTAYYYEVPKTEENADKEIVPAWGDADADGVQTQKTTYVYCTAEDETLNKSYKNADGSYGNTTITLQTKAADGTLGTKTKTDAKAGVVLSFKSPLVMLSETELAQGNPKIDALIKDFGAKIGSEEGKINLNRNFPDGLFEGLNYIGKYLVPSWDAPLPYAENDSSTLRNRLKTISKYLPANEDEDKTKAKAEDKSAEIFDIGVDMLLSIINPVLELASAAAEENIGAKNIPYVSQLWEFIGGLDEDSILCDAINSIIGNPDAKYKFTLPSLNKDSFYYLISNADSLVALVMETVFAFKNNDAGQTPPAQEPDNKPSSKDDISKLLKQIVALFKDDNGSFKLPQLTAEQKVVASPVVEYPPRDNMSDEQLRNAMDYAVKQFDIYLSGCDVEGYEYEGLLDSLTKWTVDDPYTQKLFPNKTETGPRSFMNYVYNNVFTNKIVSAAVTNLYAVIEEAAYHDGANNNRTNLIGRAVAGVISPQKIARLMGEDCGKDAFNAINSLAGWSGSTDKLLDLNWGFTDGDVSGCIKAIVAPLRMFAPVFELLFSGETLGLYERLLLPVFETLGFEGTYTLPTFNKAVADKDKDIYLLAVLSPIVNFALGLAEAPMTTIATLIPRLAYLITSGTLTKVVHGIVEPVQGLLGTVENDIIGTVNKIAAPIKDLIGGSNAKAARAQGDLIDLSKYLDPVNDVLKEVSAVELEVDIVPVLNSVINLVLNKDNSGEPIKFELLSVNWGEVVGYGEVTKMEADSTYSTVAVEHPGDPFVETIHYVISNIQDENNNKAIMGVLSNFNFDAGTQEIIDMVVGMLASMGWADLFWTIYDLLISGVKVPGMASPFVNVNTGDNGIATPVAFTTFAGFATIAYAVLTVRKKKKENEEQEPVSVR